MNKYEKSLNNLESKNYNDIQWFQDYYDDLDTLRELVEKEKPMKPANISLLTNPPQHRTRCNNCYGVHLERAFKFCPFCGQNIDWGDEE